MLDHNAVRHVNQFFFLFQAKFSQMEDDNRNVSSLVGSLAASCNADLHLIRQEVAAALAGRANASSQPPPSLARVLQEEQQLAASSDVSQSGTGPRD